MYNPLTQHLKRLHLARKFAVRFLGPFLILLVLCYNFSCNRGNGGSSTARIEVSGGNITRKELIALLPVNGNVFRGNKQTFSFDNNGKCILDINRGGCGIVLLRFDIRFISRLIVAPGDQVKVNIVTDAQGRPQLEYEGTNAAGHQFFNSLDRPLILDVVNPYSQDTNVSDIKHKIQLKMEQELSSLKALLDKGKINKAYETLAALDIRYYYAASLADAMHSKYSATRRAPNKKEAIALFSEQYGKAWELAFSMMPLHSGKALASEYFKDYARIYSELYLGQYARDKSGLLPSDTAGMHDLSIEDRGHILNYAIIDRNFKDSTAEYLKAIYLDYAMRRRIYEQSLLTLYTKFNKQYPGSPYLPFLKTEADNILAYQHTKDADFTPDQQFLPGYEHINSLSELRHALKNGPYYIDIWSTWCSPCKEEFKFNASLSAALREYNIKPLYISIDRDKEDEDWKNMIKYYKLPGLHLRATDSLSDDLTKELGKNNLLAIPRYLIIDKEGSIVNDDAERPSKLDDLRKQLNNL